MARAFWKGTISFGLVTVPVELHTAIREHRPRFHLLHATDKSPVKYDRICEREGKSVAWKDVVKGYEYEKGKFVVLTADDLKSVALEKSRTVDIIDFVPPDEIDDRFFDTPYYVIPGKGGSRAYALLREAIRESKRVGIGTVILREGQHLAALTVVENMLVLTMMRFADELNDVSQFAVPGSKEVRPKELQLAKTLVENLAADWDPEKYHDEYLANLKRLIRGKLKGKAPEVVAEPEVRPTAVVDLMDRLRQSLANRKPSAAAARGRKKRRHREAA